MRGDNTTFTASATEANPRGPAFLSASFFSANLTAAKELGETRQVDFTAEVTGARGASGKF